MDRNHSIIQQSIEYIEANLHEDLTLDTVASFAGFSKYHYHRLFSQATGVNLAEYIRYRRMANAASALLFTKLPILEIALHYRFHSQESFARTFKSFYHLPPGKYRKLMSGLLEKKEENKMIGKQKVEGWFLSGSHPYNYRMSVDHKTVHRGKGSGLLQSAGAGSAEEFATMMQQFKADNYIGKRIRLSGFLKTKDVDGFASLWMRVDDALHDVLQFDNMMDRPITGTTEWNHYFIVLDVPHNSATISFGVILSGNGSVWADELKFEEVDEGTPTTNVDFSVDLLDEPTNLSFEKYDSKQ